MTPPLLDVVGLQTSFFSPRGEVKAVDGVSLHVMPGESVGLIGESGSGKSITAASILRLVPPPGRIVSGSITLAGRDLMRLSDDDMRAVRHAEVGMIFQDAGACLNPVMSIGDQIFEAVSGHAQHTDVDRRRVIDVLKAVRIPDPERVAAAFPHQLSGGMRQRILIAAALIRDPALIVADEPTTALDATVQRDLLRLLVDLRASRNSALLFISHDLAVIAGLCQRVYIMYAGQIVEDGPTSEVFTKPAHPYTRALIASILDPWEPAGDIVALQGDPPDMAAPPTGCRLHPRCPDLFAPCADRMPALTPVGEGRAARCWLHQTATLEAT